MDTEDWPCDELRATPTTPMILILQDVTDVSKARIGTAQSEMKAVMEKSGVVGSPSIRFATAA